MRKISVVLMVLIIGVVFLCVIAGILYGYANGLRNTGVEYEKALNAQYLDNQNELSAFISGFFEQAGVNQAAGDQLKEILVETVKGRYDEGGFSTKSALFVAIREAYPEAGVNELMKNWGKLQDYISAKREAYKAKQSKLLDMLREYDTWRAKGIVQSQVIRILGFPSNGLEARIGEQVLRGQYALDKMYQIVLTKEGIEAYQKGVMEPLKVPTR